MKLIYLAFITLCLILRTVFANIHNELQFISILSPKANKNIRRGHSLNITYVMQPRLQNGVSPGYAKNLTISLYKKDKAPSEVVCLTCPIDTRDDETVTYTTEWIPPLTMVTGEYYFGFMEHVRYRASVLRSFEAVSIIVVD
ncbi:hypothetical protein BY458DRAFT_526483 [Sporodiniella umbellata]|nr:hypothetical protein BY458DRAFT_526483 [Sporodiniella umbellata]